MGVQARGLHWSLTFPVIISLFDFARTSTHVLSKPNTTRVLTQSLHFPLEMKGSFRAGSYYGCLIGSGGQSCLVLFPTSEDSLVLDDHPDEAAAPDHSASQSSPMTQILSCSPGFESSKIFPEIQSKFFFLLRAHYLWEVDTDDISTSALALPGPSSYSVSPETQISHSRSLASRLWRVLRF
jgi:hypothetical protein